MLPEDYELLLESSPDPIARFDTQLRHVYANEATSRFNARPVSDFYGKTMEDLRHAPEVCAAINGGLHRVFQDASESTVELNFDAPTLGRLSFQCRMAPEFGPDGRVKSVLVISRDITALRRAQDALFEAERRTAVAELSSTLAHAIHNPLFAARNGIYLLQHNASLDAAARELVSLVSEQIDRVCAMTAELLTLAKQT